MERQASAQSSDKLSEQALAGGSAGEAIGAIAGEVTLERRRRPEVLWLALVVRKLELAIVHRQVMPHHVTAQAVHDVFDL